MTTPRTSPDDDLRGAAPDAESREAGGQSSGTPAQSQPPGSQGRLSDHLANQRTLLAWARTGISIMALGFVVARFGLLIRELSVNHVHTTPPGAANWFGITLVIFGAVLVGLSLVRYLRIARGIDEGRPRTSPELDIIMSGGLILAGLALAIYLALTS